MTSESDATAGLRKVVENVRLADFSGVSKSLVEEILDVQFQFAEDRAEAEKLTEQAVSRWVAAHETDETN